MIPILWQGGGIVVGTHDLFSVLAVLAGFAIYYRSLRRSGLLEERIVIASIAVLVGGVVGARLITAWEHPAFYADAIAAGAPLGWIVEHSGKSILGALAGGYLAGALAKRLLGYRISTADHYALALPVATAIGRIGCFLSELPLGSPTDLPWGIAASPTAAAAFVRCPSCTVAMHPSMLYEVLFNVLAAIVIVRWRHRVVARGDLLKLYLISAFVFRFLVEFVRANEVEAFGLSGPQLVLIPLIGLLAAHFYRQFRRGAWRVPDPPPGPGRGRAPAITSARPAVSWRTL
ncbi:MAG: prolipoprotein diacylglyceryl transferase family protein [Candidatus Limnocylindrales bacterium]